MEAKTVESSAFQKNWVGAMLIQSLKMAPRF